MKRLQTKQGRERAYQIMHKRNKLSNLMWYVGVSSRHIVMLDFDNKEYLRQYERLNIAMEQLQNRTMINRNRCVVAAFETNKGFLLIALARLNTEHFKKVYVQFIQLYPPNVLDHLHAQLSIKYKKTTLRVSSKNGTQPKLVKALLPNREFKNYDKRYESRISRTYIRP